MDPLSNNRPSGADREKVLARAFLEMKNLRAKVAELERAKSEPIAIVGAGCRFPGGANDPAAYWQLLRDGVDAITDVPADRWDSARYYDPDPDTADNKMYTRRGSFVDHVKDFDAPFFGITPREAATMDPQQRILLEVTWEALENAGIAANSIAGAAGGVFIGMCGFDYPQLMLADKQLPIDGYMGSGGTHSAAAGRLSYFLGLRGPCVSVDTACSSSLVSLHLACQSLRSGECDIALSGGVNLILIPETTIIFCKARMMALDGHCKTFDAVADGYVRGEGCGVVVLKRMSDALRDGDRILALVRGSAVNQDGRSSGLTVPNGTAQEEVVQAALRNAGVLPRQIGYVEAHGTGTKLGDPIEMRALGAVLGEGRERPFRVGSVKTNIGHLEGAAGVASLLKVVMSLQNREIPPHLHFRNPNPFIDWDRIPGAVPTSVETWEPIEGRRIAGISSFGFSGTNAHVIIEEAPEGPGREAVEERPVHVLTLSAKSPAALHELVSQYQVLTGGDFADVCFTANTGRAPFAHRMAIVASDAAEAAAQWAAVTEGRAGRPRIAFLFTGQGSQYPSMGRELYEGNAIFRAVLERAEACHPGLLKVLYGPDGGLLDRTEHTQTCLYALQYGLAEVWRAWGITPSFVMGHSVGEFAAAAVAGVYSFEDGLRLVARRAALMQGLPAGGGMLSIAAGPEDVAALIAPVAGRVSIAAINGPAATVISGDFDAMEQIARQGLRCQPLKVSHAFHSHWMEPILRDLDAAARDIAFYTPRIDIVSNVTGDVVGPGELAAADYWSRHARNAVQFERSMQTLRAHGVDAFVEIGPQPVLLAMSKGCIGEAGAFLPSLRRGHSDWRQMCESLASVFTLGAPVDWHGFDAGYARRKVSLPTYPFQRERHWTDASSNVEPRGSQTLLGRRLHSPLFEDHVVFESLLSPESPAFLGQHRIAEKSVLPAAAYLAMALAADSHGTVENLVLHEPVVLEDGQTRRVQLIVKDEKVRVLSAADSGVEWKLHAEACLVRDASSGPIADFQSVRERCLPTDGIYDQLEAKGLTLGPEFRGAAGLWRGENEGAGEVRLAHSLTREAGEYAIHPVLLDACLQVAGALCVAGSELYVPVRVERMRVFSSAPLTHAWCHATGIFKGSVTSLRIANDAGEVVAELEGVHFRPLLNWRTWLYEVKWQPRTSGASLLPPAEAIESVRAEVATVGAAHGLDAYRELLPELEDLSVAFIARAFRALGFAFRDGEQLPKGSAAARLGVASRHARLVTRMAEILVEEGYFADAADAWQVVRAPRLEDPAARLESLISQYPGSQIELALLERCTRHLTRVLRNEVDALEVLFPSGSLDMLEQTYKDTAFACVANSLVERFVAQTAAAAPAGQNFRVLELGAGTGGTTASALAALPAERTSYLFTDLSPLFTSRAAARFAAHSSLRYQLLDVEKDPAGQGLAGQQFDIVLAANVLHATSDLRRSLRHIRSLLAPGGVLVMVESSGAQRWVDLIFGLTEGWWNFTDLDLRPAYPLLSVEGWRALLTSEGFELPDAIGVRQCLPGEPNQSVIFARAPLATRAATPQSHLIFADRQGVGHGLAKAIRAAGGSAVTVVPGERFLKISENEFCVDPLSASDFRSLAAHTRAQKAIHLWSLDDGDQAESAIPQCGGVLHLVQALAATPVPPALLVVTRGAQQGIHVASAALWGLGKVISLEHPELRCVRLDLDAADDVEQSIAAILNLDLPAGENEIAMRRGVPHVARLVPSAPAAKSAEIAIRADATYVITGGLGDLGLAVSRWLVSRGAKHLLLIGRSLPNAAAEETLRELRQQGAQITTAQVDISRAADLAACLQHAARSMPPIRGVIHSAGVLSDGVLMQQSLESFRAVLAPKVVGAYQLHLLTREIPLDFFVLFSSAVSLLGSPAQANHAAANSFLDALAHHRRNLGLPALSIDWGIWRDIGAAARIHATGAPGLGTISAAQGLEIFEHLLHSGRTQVGVMPMEWDSFLTAYPRPVPAFFDRVARSSAAPRMTAPAVASDFLARLKQARAGQRKAVVTDHVRETAARVIRLKSAAAIDLRQPLHEMGLDSLMAVELRNSLEASTGASLPATLLFDYPAVESLADFLAAKLAPQDAAAVETEPAELLTEVRSLSPEGAEAALLRELESLEY